MFVDTAVIQLQEIHSHTIVVLNFPHKTKIMITALITVQVFLEELFGIITVQKLTLLDYLDIQDGKKALAGMLTIIILGPLIKLSSCCGQDSFLRQVCAKIKSMK